MPRKEKLKSDAFWYVQKAVEVNSELKHLLWWGDTESNQPIQIFGYTFKSITQSKR